MKTLEWQSHRTNAPRPTEVVSVDFGRGTLRGLPAPNTRIAYNMTNLQESLYDAQTDSYLVAGTVNAQVRVVHLTTTAQTTIETYPADTRVSFARVGAWVVIAASERGNTLGAYILLLHLPSGQIVRVDRAPDVPGNTYQSQALVWTLTSAQNVQGVQVIWRTSTVYLNVTNNDNTWQVDLLPDTTDPIPSLREVIAIEIEATYIEPAAGRWAKAQILNGAGNVLVEQPLIQGKNYIDLTRLPNYAETIAAIRIVRYGGDVELSRTVWFHTLRRQYLLVQGLRPEVGNPADNQLALSEPLYLTPTQTIPGMRHIFSNNSVYNLWVYRLDSAGVYRLVDMLTPTQTRIDDKLEWELGEPFSDTLYPVRSNGLSLEWDARVVIADGNDLWLSTVGDFAWDDDADRLTFEEPIIALATWRNLLCVGLQSGWRVLIGAPSSITIQRVSDAPPVAGYRGYGALAFADGSLMLGNTLYTDNLASWRRYLRLGRYEVLLAPDHLLLSIEGRWTRVSLVASGVWLRNGQLELHTPTGVQALSGARSAWQYSTPLLFETRANLKALYLDGTGALSVQVGTHTFTTTLPAYIDRLRVEEWHTTLSIAGQPNAELYCVVIEFEPAKPR
jgi:hypothetical protein